MKITTYQCDFCEKKIDLDKLHVTTGNATPYDEPLFIIVKNVDDVPGRELCFVVRTGHYCDIDCFINHLKTNLGAKK
jgi:hypothetical protein